MLTGPSWKQQSWSLLSTLDYATIIKYNKPLSVSKYSVRCSYTDTTIICILHVATGRGIYTLHYTDAYYTHTHTTYSYIHIVHTDTLQILVHSTLTHIYRCSGKCTCVQRHTYAHTHTHTHAHTHTLQTHTHYKYSSTRIHMHTCAHCTHSETHYHYIHAHILTHYAHADTCAHKQHKQNTQTSMYAILI